MSELHQVSKRDPVLLERAVYAFGLLEALCRVDMPFIFKGGTCLMLLLEHPMRLSTDIDIIVEPGTEIDVFIKKAAFIFPFISYEEQIRQGKNKIVKRHFKFTYDSPVNGKPFYILLDVLIEENHYTCLVKREIKNELLLTGGEMLTVQIPDINCILADKLAAFAPHTTGILLGGTKDMEVMKQMYDVCSLLDVHTDFAVVRETYRKVSLAEIAYRGNEIKPEDALNDTHDALLTIASRGKFNLAEYLLYVRGIRDLRGHIYAENYSPEIAAIRAVKVLYFVMCLLKIKIFTPVADSADFGAKTLQHEIYTPLRYLRK
ncbi:MAG TPA: hypothetical protein DF409_10765, partial [Bacteroidales bacterium]|nr:hypothetical protein [Bacteroidales bacterium]